MWFGVAALHYLILYLELNNAYYGADPKKCLKLVVEEVFRVLCIVLLVGYYE